jgi:hypothetical protein
MKLIIVNVSKTSSIPLIDATKRAWKLNLKNCIDCDFVVAVGKGKIEGVFKFINASKDLLETDRVAFCLEPTTPFEEFVIRFAIDYRKINISGFVVKSVTDADIFNV